MKNFGRMKKCITFAAQKFKRVGIALYYGGLFLYPFTIIKNDLRSSCAVAVTPAKFSLKFLQQVTDAFIFTNYYAKKREFMGSHTLCGSRFNGKAEEAEV